MIDQQSYFCVHIFEWLVYIAAWVKKDFLVRSPAQRIMVERTRYNVSTLLCL